MFFIDKTHWNLVCIKFLEAEGLTHEKYNVDEQLRNYVNSGGEILACGTCIKSRELENSMEVCPISTMADCVNVVVWADKTVTFRVLWHYKNMGLIGFLHLIHI